jgi:hypothetical protein
VPNTHVASQLAAAAASEYALPAHRAPLTDWVPTEALSMQFCLFVADIDLATMTDRMEVKKAVQSGNVQEAIEKINRLNHTVRLCPNFCLNM